MIKTIGRYTLEEELVSGGFGVVYRARHPVLGRDVAIKVIKPTLLDDPSFLERFYREVRVAASLQHPNIVNVRDADESDGYHFMVMDYVEGQDLSKLIGSGERLPLNRIVHIIRQVSAALDYAHSQELIHRDVKSSNIMIGKEDQAVLTDFGIVRAVNESGSKIGRAHV